MKVTIDSKVLEAAGFSIREFAILLYYIDGGQGVLNAELCENLWERGFLMKVVDGYTIHPGKRSKIKGWTSISSCSEETRDRLTDLADKLRGIFPTGKKEGTSSYWKDSTSIIAKRLASFFKKYGEDFTDEQIVKATENYVKSFNGNYQYMRLLKYFIYKKEDGEEGSDLISYLQNSEQENIDRDWTTNMV